MDALGRWVIDCNTNRAVPLVRAVWPYRSYYGREGVEQTSASVRRD